MFADADPEVMEPRDFALLVRNTPTRELKEVMQTGQRRVILDGIFGRMPRLFRADRAGATEAVIHWRVGGGPDGGDDTYELVIAGGTCRLSPEPSGRPRLTLSLGAVDFLNLVTSNANPVAMFVKGKMKAKGDIGLVMKVPTLFDIPKV
ncbi:SCP2 sterol-binding domain-containing protein [Micromonospora chersina]|uniref:SCP2 sterol-binding domain-containing protein n=1 Tax=Micromonospora chersina TaxID=47854 RepID=UPI0033D14F61